MPVEKNKKITEKYLLKNNCFHGAYSIIFIGKSQSILRICISIAKFYTYESCGKCTPCREGTIRLLNLLKKIRDKKHTRDDLKLLKEFASHVNETSLCGLGQSSGNHILTSLKHFKEEYEKDIN